MRSEIMVVRGQDTRRLGEREYLVALLTANDVIACDFLIWTYNRRPLHVLCAGAGALAISCTGPSRCTSQVLLPLLFLQPFRLSATFCISQKRYPSHTSPHLAHRHRLRRCTRAMAIEPRHFARIRYIAATSYIQVFEYERIIRPGSGKSANSIDFLVHSNPKAHTTSRTRYVHASKFRASKVRAKAIKRSCTYTIYS